MSPTGSSAEDEIVAPDCEDPSSVPPQNSRIFVPVPPLCHEDEPSTGLTSLPFIGPPAELTQRRVDVMAAQVLRCTFRACADHRHELTGLAALVMCFAIALNVMPLARAPQRQASQPTTEQAADPSWIARAQAVSATQPPRSRSNGEAAEEIEKLSAELSAVIDDELARLGVPAVRPKARDVEPPAKLAREDRGASGPDTQPLAPIVGVWAPDENSCSARYFREGLLPTIINADGAWAGETFCIFRNQKPIETGWKVVANCSNPHEHWTTEVRLTVKDNRLMWASKRGTQAYTRCAPDFLMAAAR
jgi:hypothetical protein